MRAHERHRRPALRWLAALALTSCAAEPGEAGDTEDPNPSSTATGSTGADPFGTSSPGSTSGAASSSDDGEPGSSGSGPAPSDTETTGTPTEGWMLVWSDEFDGDEISAERWQHEVNCWGGGNGEQQCYTASPDNAFVEGGQLHIVARNEPTSGPAVNDDDPAYDPDDTSATLPYSSARLRTKNRGDWRFGRVEVRARLPFGQGTWPAIWMLPTDAVYGAWAASGEIDIMEAVNLGVGGERRVHGTLHYGSYWPANVYSGAEYSLPNEANPADDFHDYAVEWEDGEIRWYVDDHHFATQIQDGWYTLYDQAGTMTIGEGAAPFDERFHLVLNLAVGGAWAGNVNDGGVDASVFPQEMVVEYVRVYACANDPESGDGCDTVGDDYELVPGNPAP